jgi:hypothetical protein
MVQVTSLLLGGNIMKKSFRLMLGTMILGAVFAAANISISPNQTTTAGGDPVPLCPPDGCVIN